jgi:hypothetical protein
MIQLLFTGSLYICLVRGSMQRSTEPTVSAQSRSLQWSEKRYFRNQVEQPARFPEHELDLFDDWKMLPPGTDNEIETGSP